jgi:Tol biopolymer transport system component
MKSLFTFLISCIILIHSSVAQIKISLNEPPSTPSLFQPGIVSTGFAERDFALSPDESEIFYTLQSPLGYFQTIVHMKRDSKGNWSKPVIAAFGGMYTDLEPAFSPDGKRLYFSSNRPVNGDKVKDFDIWYVEKMNGEWSAIPVNLGAPINTTANEFYPSITKTGNLYYTANYKNGIGREDIFMAVWMDGKYKDPVPLDTAVNSKIDEFNSFVSPDEDFIIFTSYGRKDDMGRSDLYISQKDPTGKWMPAKNIPLLNSNRIDFCPFVSFDKKKLFFTSERNMLKQSFDKKITLEALQKTLSSPQNGSSDIYWISFDKVLESIK